MNTPVASLSPLATAVHEIEAYVSGRWDQQPRLFALAHAKSLATTQDKLPDDIAASITENPDDLIAIEQDTFVTDGTELDLTLAAITWPDTVAGAVIVVERIMVPPSVEANAPTDPEEAVSFLASHPDRHEARLVVGVLRSAESWCAIRVRSHDDAHSVATGANLVPGLIAALHATLTE